jgi:hypothetical protein
MAQIDWKKTKILLYTQSKIPKQVPFCVKPWQTPLNKAPNKGEKEKQREGSQKSRT